MNAARRWEQDGEVLVDWDAPAGRGKYVRQPRTQEQEDRRAYVKAVRDAGHTLEEIGDAVGITRERARQLLVGVVGGRVVSGVSSGKAAPTNVDPVRIAESYRRTHDAKVTAKEVGASVSAVRKCIAALGFPSPRTIRRAQRKQELLNLVRRLAMARGRTPVAWEIGEAMGRRGRNSQTVVPVQIGKKLFGSYAAMLRLAGCEPRGQGGRAHVSQGKHCSPSVLEYGRAYYAKNKERIAAKRKARKRDSVASSLTPPTGSTQP